VSYPVNGAELGMRLTQEMIDQLRKELLVLLKNDKQVKTMDFATLTRWNDAMLRWARERFNPVMDGVLKLLRKSNPWVEGKLRNASYSLRKLALPNPMTPYQHLTEEMILDRNQREVPKWSAKVRRDAQETWKLLVQEIESGSLNQDIPVLKQDKMNLEGFQVVLKYTTQEELEALAEVRAILRKYQQAAANRLPVLLKRQLPLVLDFACGMDVPHAATHEKDHIAVCVDAIMGASDGIHILAHEMGHHLYQRYLSQEDQRLWKMAVSGNYGTVDLREVLRSTPRGMSFPDYDLLESNPILYLQLEGLKHEPPSHLQSISSEPELRAYLDGGGDPLVKVRTHPISAYGAKNDEEAFCEAVGLLVGYGPKAVLPQVRQVLKIMLPEIRISSLERIVRAHLQPGRPSPW